MGYDKNTAAERWEKFLELLEHGNTLVEREYEGWDEEGIYRTQREEYVYAADWGGAIETMRNVFSY